MIRFIHAADIHLDSPLKGLSSFGQATAGRVRNATRAAFAALVDAALERSVDFVVIAGDLYDGTWKDIRTGLFFVEQMRRLDDAQIPAVILHGNHDAESEVSRRLPLPSNVHVFGAEAPATVRLEALDVALHGQSFRDKAVTDNLAAKYPEPESGAFNVGVLHTALEGGYGAHSNYAPCTAAELASRGYQYWALGHVHEHKVYGTDVPIVFPGNLQGRHANEPGARGAVLVTVDGGRCRVERLLVDVVRWHVLDVNTAAAQGVTDVSAAAQQALDAFVRARDTEHPMIVRVRLHGATAASGALFGAEERLREDLIAAAAAQAGGSVLIEKVRNDTTPKLSAATIQARGDALADVQELLERAAADEDVQRLIRQELGPFLARWPAELREQVPELASLLDGDPAPLIREVAPALVARLAARN